MSGGGVTAGVTEYGYDLAGRLRCTAVRMNPDVWATALPNKCLPGPSHGVHGHDRISKNVYDSAGRLVETWEAHGTPLERREAHYTYNANGQKLTLTDARGYLAEMKYDGFGRQSRWVFPSKTAIGVADQGDYEQYGYDVDGNRTSARKRDGSVLTFQYDALKRMTAKIVPERAGLSSAHTRDVHYEYDLRGLQTKARFDHLGGEGVTTQYDGFGRVTSSTLAMAGTSRSIGHQYDRDGNRTRITHPDGSYFNYEYDGLGRFRQVLENGASGLTVFAYDSAGRLASSGWGAPTSFGYDPAGRLQSLTYNPVGTASDHVLGFTYNPAGQVLSRSGSNDSYAWTGSVAVNRPYSVNGQNQYTAVGPYAYAYDANGNLTSDGTTTFVYDIENRLVSASGEKNASLVYDPLGRLFQTSGGAAGITRFLYDDDALIGEYNADGYMVHRYVHGTGKGVDDPLIWYNNPAYGWRQALAADQQGSIIAVADMYGNPVAINSYDEYGIPGANNQGRFQYTGQAWIPELGMYHYKSRVYSPTLGRFLQVDTIGYEGGINLYRYVSNDPINRTDPDGTQDSFELATRRDDQAYLRGDIDEAEYRERQQARGAGGVIGGALVATALVTRGAGIPGAYAALRAGGMAGLRAFMGLKIPMTATSAQLGFKFGTHYRDWGLAVGRAGFDKFKAIVNGIGTRPDRVVNGTFRGQGGRVPVQFRIKGSDVVITSRKGEFVSILRNGITNPSVQRALKQTCSHTRIAQIEC